MTDGAREYGRTRRGGRSARVRRAVLDATLGLLAERGVAGLSVAEVAARAGVHETSIYRRWRTRENLVVEAMLDNSESAIPIPDTGSVRTDLAALARAVAAFLADPSGAAFVRVAALSVDDEQVASGRREFFRSRFTLASAIVRRGIERGELPADSDARLILETLIAPLHLRLLLTHAPVEADLPERLADLICDGVATARFSPGASGSTSTRR